MKQMLMALLMLFASASYSYAQDTSFYLYIPDKNIIQDYSYTDSTTTPIFYDSNINDIVDNYIVRKIYKVSPLSPQDYLRKIYVVEANSIQLAVDLHNYDSKLFPFYRGIVTPIVLGYTPNDWGNYSNKYIDFVKARDAWAQTKGDTNIVIGIPDTYCDITHPDLAGQIAYVGINIFSQYRDTTHGTMVTGMAAAATDNTIGVPSTGFKCRVDVSSRISDWEMNEMSLKRDRRVLNASWGYNPTQYLEIDSNLLEQDLYNDIYEHGTVVVSAAGNGSSTNGNSTNYIYPAALNHNIAVSNVGWENDTTSALFNAEYVHETVAGDSAGSYTHNDRVDILAPSIRVGGLHYSLTNPTKDYAPNSGWGTSFGSPMVAGACGIILSQTSWLSPYQVEWILKKSSFDVYNVSYNKKYKGATRWTSRIGAGMLDMNAAVGMARDYNPYNPNTLTFLVKGVDINTLCAPGQYPGNPKPKMTAVLENGTAPYTYLWEPMSDNETVLSSYNSVDPTIDSSYGTHLVHYRLTVYDNTDIQKVAHRFVKIQLRTDSLPDLGMRDAYADMYNERNNMDSLNSRDWNIWESPDIWNRQLADGIKVHQDPEYFNTLPNFLYVRVKNIGCRATTAEQTLKLYWTVASTGETWPNDWDGTTLVNGLPGGALITPNVVIPIIAPGAEAILVKDWYPPKPQDYDTTFTKIGVCVLARIENGPPPGFGMTFTEDTLVKENIWNNNTIITRNLTVNNLNTSNKTSSSPSIVIVANGGSSPGTFSVEVVTEKQLVPFMHGNLGSFMTATLKLGDLYDIWVDGGRLGNVTSYNDATKSVTTDLTKPLRLDNLQLDGNARYLTSLTFTMKEGVSVEYPITNERVYMRQIIPHVRAVDNGDGTTFNRNFDEIYGDVSFEINVEADEPMEKKTSIRNQVTDDGFSLYPNPTKNSITITAPDKIKVAKLIQVTDVSGRKVSEISGASFSNGGYKMKTTGLIAGIYFITIIDDAGVVHALKFIKAD